MAEETKQAIQLYFQKKISEGQSVQITDFHQPSAGWSDEAFTFTVNWEQNGEMHQKGFAIRKQNKGGLMTEYQDSYQHFKLLDRLSKHSDLPLPGVHWYETDEAILGGTFFVMDKLPGKSYVPWSKEGKQFFKRAHEEGEIPLQFVRHLADLHLLDYKEIGLTEDLVEPSGKYGYIDSKINEFEEMYVKYLISPDPIMVDALEWLKANKPAAQRLSVVHGDYRSGNLLYSKNKITGILDWEATEIGDPMADVAYVCAKSNRMDSPLLNYLLDKQMFLKTYSEYTGLSIDENVLHYYEVFHQVRFVLISQSAGTDFAKSKTKDLRMARQGFRWPLMRGILAELLGY
ncbi:phosphotransferase family protein [Alkalihalobacterium chitinilyticum]|uniref:Phosphotransferase family protein n=1 Tax=Alkalihalobacterium chitinilyticum TaxID=2980103 RepID=A0ABT5VGE4_9BACI|nr:phosphotransferase family protein [Alkalihalobacterium chitinilyticum]MDE5414528.1 phosphotransferase family protein [Alkalihalobacterium chitinilyticum]